MSQQDTIMLLQFLTRTLNFSITSSGWYVAKDLKEQKLLGSMRPEGDGDITHDIAVGLYKSIHSLYCMKSSKKFRRSISTSY